MSVSQTLVSLPPCCRRTDSCTDINSTTRQSFPESCMASCVSLGQPLVLHMDAAPSVSRTPQSPILTDPLLNLDFKLREFKGQLSRSPSEQRFHGTKVKVKQCACPARGWYQGQAVPARAGQNQGRQMQGSTKCICPVELELQRSSPKICM